MRFAFEIAGRVRTVEIRRERDAYHVAVDGCTRFVDVSRIGEHGWSLLVRDERGSRSIDAVVVPHGAGTDGNGALDVHLAGFRIPVRYRLGTGRRLGAGAGPAAGGLQRVVAPMPGRVARVLVRAGDEVTARQGLVVVEAMKMENELRAAGDGRVREVLVTDGQSVDAGVLLVVVE